MAIFYNKVERGNPTNPEAPKKWYPVLKSLGMVPEKEVAKQISDETTLNPKEAEIALAQFQKVMIRNLLEGRTVQLGDWGSFHLTLSGTGSDTKEGVTSANVTKINIRFNPGRELTEAISKAQLKPVESLTQPPVR
ncbi:MAG: DNA-binding protein [Bacteroidetes bacterium GWF2_42_66]|nr:MAG: DNA-binding protein [Bacteroidetes bacterium GWF2_42_66]HBL73883.1 DNA-binding protein [Prolixibacteraceae bacterium]HCU63184.1 DNA-binding protein [Prolixibacteraceae bacterium]